jgi:hypothetical protein
MVVGLYLVVCSVKLSVPRFFSSGHLKIDESISRLVFLVLSKTSHSGSRSRALA